MIDLKLCVDRIPITANNINQDLIRALILDSILGLIRVSILGLIHDSIRESIHACRIVNIWKTTTIDKAHLINGFDSSFDIFSMSVFNFYQHFRATTVDFLHSHKNT